MRIGLLGFGTVGKGVYEIVAGREDMHVVKVLCRRDLELGDASVTHDFQDILKDPTIDTVVEAIGGLHPAYDYVREAILAGKNVATANKALIATCYDELVPLARERESICAAPPPSAAASAGFPSWSGPGALKTSIMWAAL